MFLSEHPKHTVFKHRVTKVKLVCVNIFQCCEWQKKLFAVALELNK